MRKLFFILLIPIVFISCSKTSDQDYLERAKNLVKDNKPTEAVTALETLLKEYPQSALAPKALVELATIYQGKMIKEIPARKSLMTAQKYFRQVFDKYPASPEAPNSLFMSSFILANHLGDFDNATAGYKLFIEKYPDNPLVASAQQELENMGLSPEQVLKKKQDSKN
jgi:TolA-binding protein